MAFDHMHRLFVVNPIQGIQAFAPPIVNGAAPSFVVYADVTPNDITFDAAGDAVVSGRRLCGFFCTHGFIDVFTAPVSKGSTVSFEIQAPGPGRFTSITGIAFDGSGNLWAKGSGKIMKYTPPFNASSAPVLDFPDSYDGGGLTFDSAGKMYTAGANGIDVYTPPFSSSTTTAFTINTGGTAAYIAFDAAGNLYATTMNGNLLEFAPPLSGSSSPMVTLAVPGGPSNANAGIAIEP
jgi:hypothetical protein